MTAEEKPLASRQVTLLLVDAAGGFVGVLPEFENAFPWWPETESLQRDVRDRFGVDVTIVRIVDSFDSRMNGGGGVTYLAELQGDPSASVVPPAAVEPAVAQLVRAKVADDQPNRASWARPGAVSRAVAWADQALSRVGRPRSGPVVQVKSWNLSLVLMLPTARGPVWLKATPPFLGHEGAAIELVAERHPDLVPQLLARDAAGCLVLMADVPGEDQWQAPLHLRMEMVRLLVRLQAELIDCCDELLAAGLPDARLRLLPAEVEDTLSRVSVRQALTAEELAQLHTVARRLPQRIERIEACGIPETLVRGDFHPGNWRYDGHSLVLLDWGDSEVGHPLLDVAGFLSWIADEDARGQVRASWSRAWREVLPDSDPDRAIDLVEPLGHLRGAVIYQRFLDHIEDDEQRYHASDVPEQLREALADERLFA